MKKTFAPLPLLPLLSLLLLCPATGAHAELRKVFENIRGTMVYVDTSTLTGTGETRRVTEIQTYKTPGPRGMLSMKLLKEYHCKNETAQIINYVMYAGTMASGEVIGKVNTPGDVQKLTQNPGGTGGYRFACGL